jgi:hypothetical protein
LRLIGGVASAIDKVGKRAVFSEYGGVTVNIGKRPAISLRSRFAEFRGKIDSTGHRDTMNLQEQFGVWACFIRAIKNCESTRIRHEVSPFH